MAEKTIPEKGHDRLNYIVLQEALTKTCNHLVTVFKHKWAQQHGDDWETSHKSLAKKFFSNNELKLTPGDNKILLKIHEWDISLVTRILNFASWSAPMKVKGIQRRALQNIQKIRNQEAHSNETCIPAQDLERCCATLADSLGVLGVKSSETTELRKLGKDINDNEGNIYEATIHKETVECKRLVDRGDECFKRKEFQEALVFYNSAINKCPMARSEQRSRCHTQKSRVLYELRDLKRAYAEANEATRCDDTFASAHLILARVNKAQFKYYESMIAFERALSLDDSLRITYQGELEICRSEAEKASRQEYENPAYVPEIHLDNEKEMTAKRFNLPTPKGPLLRRLSHRRRDTQVSLVRAAQDHLIFKEFKAARELFMKGILTYKSADCAYNLGLMYNRGQGVPQDINKALCYFKLATTFKPANYSDRYEKYNGIGQSYNAIGIYHRQNEHTAEAFRNFKQAEKYYCPSGCNNLGHMYLTGTGCSQDLQLAEDLFRKSWKTKPTGEAALLLYFIQKHSRPKVAKLWLKAAEEAQHPLCEDLLEKEEEGTNLPDLPSEFDGASFQALHQYVLSDNRLPKPLHFSQPQNFCPQTSFEKSIQHAFSSIANLTRGSINECASALRSIRQTVQAISGPKMYKKMQELEVLKSLPKHPKTADEGLLHAFKACCDPNLTMSETILHLDNLRKKFPSEVYILSKLGLFLLSDGPEKDFEKGHRILVEAHRILSDRPDSEQYCDSLYELANCRTHLRLKGEFESNIDLFRQFLEHPQSNGHRLRPIVHYQLSLLYFPKDSEKALEEFRKGENAESELMEPFLSEASKFPTKLILQTLLKVKGSAPDISPIPFGGDLLHEPFKRPQRQGSAYKTREKEIAYCGFMITVWRENRQISRNNPILTIRNPPEPKRIQIDSSIITIDEILALGRYENIVFEGGVLRCIVVSEPAVKQSMHFVVEDEHRNFIEVAVYNYSEELSQRVLPGQKAEIRNPFSRLPGDGGPPLIRVQNPKDFVLCGDRIPVCLFCSKYLQSTVGHTCTACKQVYFCDRQCQRQGWKITHKHTCNQKDYMYRELQLISKSPIMDTFLTKSHKAED
eukprot:m.347973 g.347973  ORF g.347973 m.347973 type:complete len:1085 (+) comp35149_c0_seq1:290-3544(+)